MKSPILFVIFNRPDTTRQVFETIRDARPPRLYIAADGPRDNRPGEIELCKKVRNIAKQVDWPCEVKTLFRDKNLGCGIAVCEAISWFFNNETEGIILEDDVLPHPDFFLYCDEMLEKYQDNEKVGMIGGHNLLYDKYRKPESYSFMAIGHIWGWATWRRAWEKFYYKPSEAYPLELFKNKLKDSFDSSSQRKYWENIYKIVENGVDHIWDYQWTIALIYNQMLCAVPLVNLTKNIGFSSDSTHTTTASKDELNLKTKPILPLTHPSIVEQDMKAEKIERNNSKMYVSVCSQLKSVFKRIVGK